MTIRVKIYIDGKLKKVFTDDIGDDEHINLMNTMVMNVCGREMREAGGWTRDVKWEVEVIR